MVRYYIIFDGRVQGVGFRFFSSYIARKYTLSGWVRNMDNGMVDMEIQGDATNIDNFIVEVKKGNIFIRIDDISIRKIRPIEGEHDFETKY